MTSESEGDGDPFRGDWDRSLLLLLLNSGGVTLLLKLISVGNDVLGLEKILR